MNACVFLAMACALGLAASGSPPGGGMALNEILADPPADLSGDANGDGVRDAQEDEFVELFNAGADTVDIAGWSIRDSVRVRHVFPDSAPLLLDPGELATVFGGGTPTGFTGLVFTASTGTLSLNNGGDGIVLLDREGVPVDSHDYGAEGGHDLSLVRIPDGSGSWYVAGDGGSFAPHSAHRLNGGMTGRQGQSWGRVKLRFTSP